MLRINLFFLFFLFFISCKRDVDGVILTENNLEIFFHDVSNTGSRLQKDHYLNLFLLVNDLHDKLVFSSKFHGLNGVSSFLYDSTLYNSTYSNLFENIIEGDSVSFNTSLNEFFSCFLKYNDSDSQLLKQDVKVSLRFISSCNQAEQDIYIRKLTLNAINNENKKLNRVKNQWNLYYDNIIDIKSIYSRLVTNETYEYGISNDSVQDYYVVDYTLTDLDGRFIYSTDLNSPQYFQKNKDGQLLKGFELLLNRYKSGDSVHAILPSSLAFYEKGAFTSMIPPFTALEVNLRIR